MKHSQTLGSLGLNEIWANGALCNEESQRKVLSEMPKYGLCNAYFPAKVMKCFFPWRFGERWCKHVEYGLCSAYVQKHACQEMKVATATQNTLTFVFPMILMVLQTLSASRWMFYCNLLYLFICLFFHLFVHVLNETISLWIYLESFLMKRLFRDSLARVRVKRPSLESWVAKAVDLFPTCFQVSRWEARP